jgi:NAD(P)-dependent dehydrogenase (short-subunit alcohol dehydrogenase family)
MSDHERTIVVTGGGSGIGRALALLCAERRYKIAILDKNGASAQASAQEAQCRGASQAVAFECDVGQENSVAEAFNQISSQLGAVYGLFANAGIDIGGVIHDLPIQTWNAILATNLTGVFLSCKYALRQMLAANIGGSIVCTSSPTGFVALAAGGAGAYSATKAGISALVRCMAVDYARFGIRINAIVPGATETPLMWNNVPPQDIPRMRDQVSREIPLGRLADPADPAKAVLWLLSDDSAYVTGSHLICDGGILAKASITV